MPANSSDFWEQEPTEMEERLFQLYCMAIFGQTELDTYADYLAYRVQQDLYALCKEEARWKGAVSFDNVSWNDFIREIQRCPRTRSAARIVMRRTLGNFFDHGEYRFDLSRAELPRDCGDWDIAGDIRQFAPLFLHEEGRTIIYTILLHTEQAYYRRRRSQGAVHTRRQYLEGLFRGRTQWQYICAAVRDALVRLDFKPVWRAEDLADAAAREENEEKLED